MNKFSASPQAMLIVRFTPELASLHWQLLAPGEPHHEASSRWSVDDASPFPALTAYYPVWVLIPASSCAFHSFTPPTGLRKPPLRVVPFLLEERLADDAKAAYFVLLRRQQVQCEIVAVQRQKIRDQSARCESFSLWSLALTPDILALPWYSPAWGAVQVDEQWLTRRQPWGDMVTKNVWPMELLQSEAGEPIIDNYSPPPAASGVRRTQPTQTLLTLTVRYPATQQLSLLQRGFAVRWRQLVQATWRSAQRAAPVLALLMGTNSMLDHLGLARQAEATQQASRAFYHRWLPTEKRVINPRPQIQQHPQTLACQAQRVPLVDHLSAPRNIPSDTPGIRLRTLSWDAASNRLQLDIVAASSQALEQFTQQA